jgi:anti-anti-sigma regulatory factor
MMVDGRFPVEVVDGVAVVIAPEEIDITNAPELRAALLEAAAHGPGTLVADLAQAEGSELLLVMTSPPVLRVFELTGIDHMIRNFTSLEEALARRSATGSAGPGQTGHGPDGSTAATAGLAVRTAVADLTKEPADAPQRARTGAP